MDAFWFWFLRPIAELFSALTVMGVVCLAGVLILYVSHVWGAYQRKKERDRAKQ